MRDAGEGINELYTLGFGRVGCAPCVNIAKDDLTNWSARRPDMLNKIRGYEQRTGITYFRPMLPGRKTGYNTIDQVLEWAKTMRGGKVDQGVFPIMNEREGCESKYGLCE